MIQWPIQVCYFDLAEGRGNTTFLNPSLGKLNNPIAEVELLRRYEATKRKSFVGILFAFSLVLHYATLLKAAFLQMK